jgi:hypothetical protein
MSKTYKSGFIKDRARTSRSQKLSKRLAKKAYRKLDIANGGAFKKAYNSWNISDYSFYDWNVAEYPKKIKPKNKWILKEVDFKLYKKHGHRLDK